MSLEQTGGGEGIEILINEPFNPDVHPPTKPLEGNNQVYTTGQYTHKHYYLESKIPRFVKILFPRDAFVLNEEAWNAFPCCKTFLTSPNYMKDGFLISIETMHVDDNGNTYNVHHLSQKELAERKVVHIDIGNDTVKPSDYKEQFDPAKFVSEKTGLGPLVGNWQEMQPVMMCAYKLVHARFKWWGIQHKAETMIMNQEQRLFTNFHRMLFCMLDKWHGMTMEQVLEYEVVVKHELDRRRTEDALQLIEIDE